MRPLTVARAAFAAVLSGALALPAAPALAAGSEGLFAVAARECAADDSGSTGKDGPSQAPAPPKAAPPAPGSKTPIKEEKGPPKKRFFRSPAGTMLLIVVGALAVGSLARSTLDRGQSRTDR